MKCYGCFEELNNDLNVCPCCGYVVGAEVEEAIFMEPGTRMRDRYTIGRAIGFGGFGVTYIAWDDVLEQKVAIKEYLPGEFSTRVPGQSQVKVFNGEKTQQFHDGMKQFVDEAKRLAKFQNENGIVKIFDSFEENNTAYIVMEYLEGWTLTDFIKSNGVIDEDTAVEMIMPVMESLKKVHEVGLLHRDIAPDNIFLTKMGEVKLIDFGAARFATTSHSRSLTVIIKPGFSPEEQYRSRGDQGTYTDVYALAATLYKMMTGATPPDALERRAKYETKSQDLLEPPKKLNKKISSVRDVALLNALNVRIEDRTPDIDTFISELNAEIPAKRIYGKLKRIDLYRWPTWLKGSLTVAFTVIILFGSLLATGVIHFDSLFARTVVVPAGMVIVPNVEGMKSDKAIVEIEKVGLYATSAGNVESEYVEAGKILLQSPAGEFFAFEGSEVSLIVSSGKQQVVSPDGDELTMPYIIWGTLESAQAKLKEAGFERVTVTEEYSDSVAAGQVISANLKDGEKTKKGAEVALVVSKGVEPAKAEEREARLAAAKDENKRAEEESNNNTSSNSGSSNTSSSGNNSSSNASTNNTNSNNNGSANINNSSNNNNNNSNSSSTAAETWSDWTPGAWIETKAATCTSDGTRIRTLSRTSSKGKTETQTETESISALGHSYTTKVVEATTSSQGYTIHTCSRCRDSYKDHYTDKKDSSPDIINQETWGDWQYGSWVAVQSATCTSAGTKERTLSRTSSKGNSETKKETQTIPAIGHSWADVTETIHHDAVMEYVFYPQIIKYRPMSYVNCECGEIDEKIYASDDALCDTRTEAYDYANKFLRPQLEGIFERHSEPGVCKTGGTGIGVDGVYEIVQEMHYEESDRVQIEAWDETIVTGQKCSVCGATK